MSRMSGKDPVNDLIGHLTASLCFLKDLVSLVSSEWEIRLFQVCKITLQNFRQFEKPQPFKNTIKQHEGLIIEGLMI